MLNNLRVKFLLLKAKKYVNTEELDFYGFPLPSDEDYSKSILISILGKPCFVYKEKDWNIYIGVGLNRWYETPIKDDIISIKECSSIPVSIKKRVLKAILKNKKKHIKYIKELKTKKKLNDLKLCIEKFGKAYY